jgi:hypothetical protein
VIQAEGLEKQHPIVASLAWSIALLALFAPLATVLYRGRTTG